LHNPLPFGFARFDSGQGFRELSRTFGDRKMVSGKAMNQVYGELRELTKRQIVVARDVTVYGLCHNQQMVKLFRHQCNVALERGWHK